jgi:hypothetical protein
VRIREKYHEYAKTKVLHVGCLEPIHCNSAQFAQNIFCTILIVNVDADQEGILRRLNLLKVSLFGSGYAGLDLFEGGRESGYRNGIF